MKHALKTPQHHHKRSLKELQIHALRTLSRNALAIVPLGRRL